MKPHSGQKSASVWSFSALIAAAGPSPVAAVEASSAAVSSVEAELAHVAAVEPAQLLLVELRRVALHARDVEARDQLLGREDRLVVAGAPAEQRDVVAHRGGQVAGVAQLLHRGGAVALGELAAVGPVQQRQVAVARRAGAERVDDQQLLGGVGEVVVAADRRG